MAETDATRAVVERYLSGAVDHSQIIAPDARMWIAGPPTYGRVLSREEYLAQQQRFREFAAGPFRQTLGAVLVDGTRATVQCESFVELVNGKTYNNQYHLYFEVRDGLVVTYKCYYDTLHFTDGFSGRAPLLGGPPRATNLFDAPSGGKRGTTATEFDVRAAVVDHFAGRRSRSFEELMDPGVRMWIAGPPTFGRVLKLHEYLDQRQQFLAHTDGPWLNRAAEPVVDGNRAAIQLESTVRMADGRTYNNQYHMYFEFEGDSIVVYKCYYDTQHFADIFDGHAAILGQQRRFTNLFDASSIAEPQNLS